MSRTTKNNDYANYLLNDISTIKTAIQYLLRTKDVEYFIETERKNYLFFRYGDKYKCLISFKLSVQISKLPKEEKFDATLLALKNELKKAIRKRKIVNSDRANWFGSVKKSVKAYSNQKSRSGKRDLLTNVMKKADLNHIDDLYDELLFDEPKLGQIKGAIWCFD